MFKIGSDGVYDHLSLLRMDEEIQEAIHNKNLSLYQAVIISRFPLSERSEIFRKTMEERLSVSKLRSELKKVTSHPFYKRSSEDFSAMNRWHSLRFFRNPNIDYYLEIYWEALQKFDGVPSPGKCEFTSSIPAKKAKPPYICDNDVEWVILAAGKSLPPGTVADWEDIPLEERPGWFFLCDRCAHLMFPNATFHHDKHYKILLQNLGYDSPPKKSVPKATVIKDIYKSQKMMKQQPKHHHNIMI